MSLAIKKMAKNSKREIEKGLYLSSSVGDQSENYT